MYERHFGLIKKPFEVSPDPRFLYLGASHREALASLRYGIQEGRGFISLVGEVGTGKTTLIRTLLDDLGDSVRPVLVPHTTVPKMELLRMILVDREEEEMRHISSFGYSRLPLDLQVLLNRVRTKADRRIQVMLNEEQRKQYQDELDKKGDPWPRP